MVQDSGRHIARRINSSMIGTSRADFRSSVLTLYGDPTDLYIRPSGELVDLKEMPDSLDEKTYDLPSWQTTRRDGSTEEVCCRRCAFCHPLTRVHTTRPRPHSTPPRDSATDRTSWRSDVSSPWMRRHTGGSRQDTHGTPVPSLLGRPWVAHPRPRQTPQVSQAQGAVSKMVAEHSDDHDFHHDSPASRRATNPRTGGRRPKNRYDQAWNEGHPGARELGPTAGRRAGERFKTVR